LQAKQFRASNNCTGCSGSTT